MKIISAVAGLTDIQAGIKGSFLWNVLVKMEDKELLFLRVTFFPQSTEFMPTQYVGNQNPKNDDEFEQAILLLHAMLSRRKHVSKKEVADEIAALLMMQSATTADILESMPYEIMEIIYEKIRKVLLLHHTDLLFTRPNNKRKKVYTEQKFGQVFIDKMGGIKEFGSDEMQKEITKFKNTYQGVYLKKLI